MRFMLTTLLLCSPCHDVSSKTYLEVIPWTQANAIYKLGPERAKRTKNEQIGNTKLNKDIFPLYAISKAKQKRTCITSVWFTSNSISFCCPMCKKQQDKLINLELPTLLCFFSVRESDLYIFRNCPTATTRFSLVFSMNRRKQKNQNHCITLKQQQNTMHIRTYHETGDWAYRTRCTSHSRLETFFKWISIRWTKWAVACHRFILFTNTTNFVAEHSKIDGNIVIIQFNRIWIFGPWIEWEYEHAKTT